MLRNAAVALLPIPELSAAVLVAVFSQHGLTGLLTVIAQRKRTVLRKDMRFILDYQTVYISHF
jgi:hypothetical protein